MDSRKTPSALTTGNVTEVAQTMLSEAHDITVVVRTCQWTVDLSQL